MLKVTINKICLLDGNSTISSPTIKILAAKEKQIIIVEADEYANPSEYPIDVFNSLRSYLNNNTTVYLNLYKYYGSKLDEWLYKWDFIMENNTLIDMKLTPAKEIKGVNNVDINLFKEYFNIKSIQEEAACV